MTNYQLRKDSRSRRWAMPTLSTASVSEQGMGGIACATPIARKYEGRVGRAHQQ